MFDNPYDIKNRIKREFKYQEERVEPQDIGEFQRLNDYISKNQSPELWGWTMQQDSVKNAEASVMAYFNSFLFEMVKPQFAKYCKDNNLDVISEYVDTAINTSKEYVSPVEKYEDERKQMQAIMAQQAEQIKLLTAQSQNTRNDREVVRV